MSIAGRMWLRLGLLGFLWPAWAAADVTVTRPYAGVTYIVRTETTPRSVTMHVLEIDLDAPGLTFRVTPHDGPLDTYKQTTLSFLSAQGAQIAINAHFFEPWPPPNPDPGTADLVGFAASDGRVVKGLARGPVECCRHALVWDGTDEQGASLAPGCYLLQVIHEGGVLSRKIAIVR